MSESIYQIISRKEAIKQGLKFYFTGKMCKHGHLCEKRVSDYCCVECTRVRESSDEHKRYQKGYRQSSRGKERNKIYRQSDKGRENENRSYHKNYEAHKEQQKEYNRSDKHKEWSRRNDKHKRSTDPLFKLRGNIRTLIRNSMASGGFKKSSKTAEILGCSYEEFKIHIENQFTEGMNWSNHGKWHYDHIYPIARAIDEAHMIKINHYTNFQPLWAEDNRAKGSKILS